MSEVQDHGMTGAASSRLFLSLSVSLFVDLELFADFAVKRSKKENYYKKFTPSC